jgi:hypothetical protein
MVLVGSLKERIEDSRDGALWLIGKFDHPKFNHLVSGGIQSSGFHVE